MIVKLLTADPTPKAHHNDTFPSRLAGGLRGRILQPRSLTDRIFAALCPWSAGQAGWSVSTCEDDLLCTNAQTPRKAKDTEAAQRLVYLRLETHNATEAKVGQLVISLAVLLAYASLIILLAVKYAYRHRDQVQEHSIRRSKIKVYFTFCLCIAGPILFIVTFRFCLFTHSIWSSWRQGRIWRPRRVRLAAMAWMIGLAQVINKVAWVMVHAFGLALPCHFTGRFVAIMAFLRMTCWNVTLYVFLMMAHSLLAWMPVNGSKQQSGGQALVLDAPIWFHLDKLPLWIGLEIANLLTIAPQWLHFVPHAPRETGPDCLDWDYSYACKSFRITAISSVVMSVLVAVYFVVYIYFITCAFRQMRQRPCTEIRAARVMLQLQLRSVMLAFKIVLISNTLLRFLGHRMVCWTYIMTAFGEVPMEIIGAGVAWHFCWLYAPKDAKRDPVVQVWLQDFAWTEEEVPQRVSQRKLRGQGEHDVQQLAAEPMFCMETALKLHHWSSLAYTHTQREERAVAGGKGGGQAGATGAKETPEGLVEMQAHMQDVSMLDRGAAELDPLSNGHVVNQEEPGQGDVNYKGLCMHAAPAGSSSGDLGDVMVDSAEDRVRQSEQLLEEGMVLYRLTDIKVFWDRQLDTKVLMAWSKSMVVLAFRGTASLANAKSDLKVWRMVHPPRRGLLMMGTMPLVHTGFYRAWAAKGLNHEVLGHLQGLISSGAVHQDARICVTGHSLGGALAVLAAYDIACQLRPHRMQVITFGSPYPGNHAFCREYEALIPDTWAVIHDRDPIPRSGKFMCLFKRPGHRVRIDKRGQMIVRPNHLELQVQQSARKVGHHFLEAYQSALIAVCQEQHSHRGLDGGREGVNKLASLPELSHLQHMLLQSRGRPLKLAEDSDTASSRGSSFSGICRGSCCCCWERN